MNHVYDATMFVILCSIVLGIIYWRRSDTAMRVFLVFQTANYLSEFIADYAAARWRNNMPVYGIYSIVSLCLNCLYFNYSIDVFKSRHIGYYLALSGLVGGWLNFLYLESLFTLAINVFAYESVLITIMALFSFTRLMLVNSSANPARNPHFWLGVILAFNWSMSLCYLALYRYDVPRSTGLGKIALYGQWLVNLVCNLGLVAVYVFLIRRSPRPRHAG